MSVLVSPGCEMTHCIQYRLGENLCWACPDGSVRKHACKAPGWCSSRHLGPSAAIHMEKSQSPGPPGSTSPQRSRSGHGQPLPIPLVMHCPLRLEIYKK